MMIHVMCSPRGRALKIHKLYTGGWQMILILEGRERKAWQRLKEAMSSLDNGRTRQQREMPNQTPIEERATMHQKKATNEEGSPGVHNQNRRGIAYTTHPNARNKMIGQHFGGMVGVVKNTYERSDLVKALIKVKGDDTDFLLDEIIVMCWGRTTTLRVQRLDKIHEPKMIPGEPMMEKGIQGMMDGKRDVTGMRDSDKGVEMGNCFIEKDNGVAVPFDREPEMENHNTTYDGGVNQLSEEMQHAPPQMERQLGRSNDIREGEIMGQRNRESNEHHNRGSLNIRYDERHSDGRPDVGAGNEDINDYNSDSDRGWGTTRSSESEKKGSIWGMHKT
ncbi:hypothetical protein Sjap_005702 [Stephania japonica]|uniref:Uncharacterized protein n=1 Tax=Stephania japonica TaxID=461633 RepID=A0AAP0K628_9MAGN